MGTRGERRSEDSGARSVRGRQPERMLRVIAETTERVDVFRVRRVRSCSSLSDNKYHPSLHKPTLSASFLPYELCYRNICTMQHFFARVCIDLHLHLVILQMLLSKATYNWGIHKAINLEEANRERNCS